MWQGHLIFVAYPSHRRRNIITAIPSYHLILEFTTGAQSTLTEVFFIISNRNEPIGAITLMLFGSLLLGYPVSLLHGLHPQSRVFGGGFCYPARNVFFKKKSVSFSSLCCAHHKSDDCCNCICWELLIVTALSWPIHIYLRWENILKFSWVSICA